MEGKHEKSSLRSALIQISDVSASGFSTKHSIRHLGDQFLSVQTFLLSVIINKLCTTIHISNLNFHLKWLSLIPTALHISNLIFISNRYLLSNNNTLFSKKAGLASAYHPPQKYKVELVDNILLYIELNVLTNTISTVFKCQISLRIINLTP